TRADRVDQRPPDEAHGAGQIELQLTAHAHEPRRILDPPHVARKPIEIVRNPREHQAASSTSTTHVSFAPPPCDEFTTSEPLFIATRVKPPVVTYTSCPERMK